MNHSVFNKENYRRIKKEFEQRHFRAQSEADARTLAVEAAIPELAAVDRALRETGVKIFGAALSGKEGLDERISALRRENTELQTIRGDILESHGYPRDYTRVKYECPACDDTGFTKESNGETLCVCMRRALVLAGYESSGIGPLLSSQTFETFSLDYYRDPSDRERMRRILEEARRFVGEFDGQSPRNIVMFGGTGLGKTHLSTACAKALIDRGFDVVYDTAQNIFSAFEREQFDRASLSPDEPKPTSRFFECDLLIIDDLGAELSNAFTVSCLYNLLNTRLNHRHSVIISTNLDYPRIKERYGDRISSRLLGEYLTFAFAGRDVRMEKIRGI